MRWHADAPSDKQLQILSRMGFDTTGVLTKGYASVLLDRVMTRRALKLATPKQVAWLRKTGHPHPETATFDEAGDWLAEQFERRAV